MIRQLLLEWARRGDLKRAVPLLRTKDLHR